MPEANLTLFFIVEAPNYQVFACYLAASIKQQFDEPIKLIGYCPAHKLNELDPKAVAILEKMGVEIRTFEAEGKFAPDYPHGNKILACLEPRETPYSGFVDSDVLFLKKNKIENILTPGKVSLTPAASMYWAQRSLWPMIYGALGMDVPEERIYLLRQKGRPKVPYFSSGFFTFPEGPLPGVGKRFSEVWMDVAQTIDGIEDLENKRPYLDQMSLPVAIKRAGAEYHLMPEKQHWILGGSLRNTPFPTDRDIHTVHYRKWEILGENDLARPAKRMLHRHAGVKKVSQFVL